MEFLFAPTVPSEPRPQNLQDTVLASARSGSAANLDGAVGNIINDTNGEVVFLCCPHVVKYCDNLCRSHILGGQTVSACQNLCGSACFDQCGTNIAVKRLCPVRRVPLFCPERSEPLLFRAELLRSVPERRVCTGEPAGNQPFLPFAVRLSTTSCATPVTEPIATITCSASAAPK